VNPREKALLRQALTSIQAHAAGLHASAEMALQLLAGSQGDGGQREAMLEQIRRMAQGGPGRAPTHYGDPSPEEAASEVEKLFNAGAPQGGAPGGAIPSDQE
jgi:hypothetical protein